jgi:hypothetical protein
MWKYCPIVGLVLIWGSVVVIPYGTYLQEQAELEFIARNAGRDFPPGIGIAVPFWGSFCVFIGLVYTWGVPGLP